MVTLSCRSAYLMMSSREYDGPGQVRNGMVDEFAYLANHDAWVRYVPKRK